MAWKVKKEHPDHFEVEGNSGPFRISKQNLSEGGLVTLRRGLSGAKKPAQGLDDGGEVRQSLPSVEDPNPGVPLAERTGPTTPAAPPQDEGNVGGGGPFGLLRPVDLPAEKPGENLLSYTTRLLLPKDAETPPAADPAAPAGQAAEQGTPSSLAVRPGEPGGAALPERGTGTQSSSGEMRLPPVPMADWGSVQKKIDEAQARGNTAADTQAQAESTKAAALTSLYSQHVSDLQKIEAQRQEETKAVQSRIDKMVSDLQSPDSNIKADHFWSEKGTFAKVRAGLGMILSGIGSGLTGQPNMAAQFIQRGIDRDIEVQKANLGKKENALGWAYKQYGNVQDAAAMTRGHLLATLAAQVGLEASRTGDLQARAQAEILKSQLAQAAVQSQATVVQGKFQNAMMQRQLQFQMAILNRFGAGAQEPGYVPSGAPPPMLSDPSLKGISELEKAKGEARVELPGGQFTYADPRRAKEASDALAHIGAMEKALGDMETLGRTHKYNINAPWPNKDKVAFRTAANALDLGMSGLSQNQRFTQPEDVHYRQMVGEPHLYLFGNAGKANAAEFRKIMINGKRQKVYDSLGVKMPGAPAFTPLGKTGTE